MPARSTTSEFQPAPPINRIATKGGDFANRCAFRTVNSGGIKPNVGCPPPPGSTRQLALRLTLR